MLVAYVAHEARTHRPASDGASTRAHLEAAAAKGNVDAMKALHGPAFPDAVAYLYRWFGELSASRPEGMAGIAPLTYAQIESWSRLTGQCPEPHEVSALLEIDLAYRVAMRGDESTSAAVAPSPTPAEAWPVKKLGGGHG